MNACGFFVLSRPGQSVYTLVQMVGIMSRLPFKLYSSFDHCWQRTVDRDCHWPKVDLVIIFNTSFYWHM